MSNVDDRLESLEERRKLEDRYASAKAALLRNRRIEEGQAGALVFAALAYGNALEESSAFAKASHLAKLFCIAAALIVPNLLVIHVLL
ncbi:hypothetical protein KUH32_05850 [Thalassococcus sp. CAU 1522]|uniref:Uncharacterized protein n=1 Tax=Thalassococcus arenae TaxID=2851652 RepID=A0ABS6N5K2_9RHOB|nr:hypothetical protein [Thalassococcus arenae]MBV2359286.1 hypothetical protein [Thalassococcus arenae]